jgi:hypothetical protein
VQGVASLTAALCPPSLPSAAPTVAYPLAAGASIFPPANSRPAIPGAAIPGASFFGPAFPGASISGPTGSGASFSAAAILGEAILNEGGLGCDAAGLAALLLEIGAESVGRWLEGAGPAVGQVAGARGGVHGQAAAARAQVAAAYPTSAPAPPPPVPFLPTTGLFSEAGLRGLMDLLLACTAHPSEPVAEAAADGWLALLSALGPRASISGTGASSIPGPGSIFGPAAGSASGLGSISGSSAGSISGPPAISDARAWLFSAVAERILFRCSHAAAAARGEDLDDLCAFRERCAKPVLLR